MGNEVELKDLTIPELIGILDGIKLARRNLALRETAVRTELEERRAKMGEDKPAPIQRTSGRKKRR